MSLKPLDLAQNIQNQAQQAQHRAAELAQERAGELARDEKARAEAHRQLTKVQKQSEAEGKVIHDDHQPHQHDPDNPSDHHAAHSPELPHEPHHPPHVDETPEGKGRQLDLDV